MANTPVEKPTAEETARWQKRLASQANNHAWDLSENPSRTSQEAEDMLMAATAAAYWWNMVGNASQKAQANLLLAHAYALMQLPKPAQHYWSKADAYFSSQPSEPWEKALCLCVASNVAFANDNTALHAQLYDQAKVATESLVDSQDRAIIGKTLNIVPLPTS